MIHSPAAYLSCLDDDWDAPGPTGVRTGNRDAMIKSLGKIKAIGVKALIVVGPWLDDPIRCTSYWGPLSVACHSVGIELVPGMQLAMAIPHAFQDNALYPSGFSDLQAWAAVEQNALNLQAATGCG